VTAQTRSYRIAAIPGDGIGQEVIPAGIRVLDTVSRRFGFALEWQSFPWGADYYASHGVMMPRDGLSALYPFNAIYLGSVGDPRVPDDVTLHGLLLPIRRGFDQYACVRPARSFPGVTSPLARQPVIDLIVVRENTEGEYADVGGAVYSETPAEVVMQTSVFTRHGTERIIRFAFDLARQRRKRLTSITKSNAQRYSMTFWDRVFQQLALDYLDVTTESLLVDAACMDLVRRPDHFDVIVASNLFGDILTDLSAAVTGGMGLAPSANLNPARTGPSMFEPVHGSAPDIAGRGVANPIATVLAGAMMLDFLGEHDAASALNQSVAAVLEARTVRSRDLGGDAGTDEMSDAVIHSLDRQAARPCSQQDIKTTALRQPLT
jgi:tartrate dehydrogenase/decarboxylase / D-malate dehydrogenase